MRITNAFKILINNSSVIYKSMFFKLIVASILCLIGYFIIANDVGYLVNSPQVHDFWNAILTTFNEFIKGNGVNTQLLPQAFDAIKIMIRENAKELITALLKVGGFVFLLNFFNLGKFSLLLLLVYACGFAWSLKVVKKTFVIFENLWYNTIKKNKSKRKTKEKFNADEISNKS